MSGKALYSDFGGGRNSVGIITIPHNSLYMWLSLFVLYLTIKDFLNPLSEAGMLTMVFSMWSCSESMSKSPTGFQPFRTASASFRSASSSSIAPCRSLSFSNALSTCFCQLLVTAFRLSHFPLTSDDCLRMALAIFWALSSGVNSVIKKKKTKNIWTLDQLYILRAKCESPFEGLLPAYASQGKKNCFHTSSTDPYYFSKEEKSYSE